MTTTTRMKTTEEHELEELGKFHLQLKQLKTAQTQHERIENYEELMKVLLEHPEAKASLDKFFESADWILQGSYGFGAYKYAMNMIGTRQNKRAWLFMTTAALEWGVDDYYARKLWARLPEATRVMINESLQDLWDECERQINEE